MNKPPRWHKDAPASKAKTHKGLAMWAKPAMTAEPDIVMPDGTAFDFKTLPPGTYDAKLTKKGAAKIIKGLGKGLAEHHKPPQLDPKRCIAAGGRMRCMDCRCGQPSPKNVTQERMPDYGTKSGHWSKRKGVSLK